MHPHTQEHARSTHNTGLDTRVYSVHGERAKQGVFMYDRTRCVATRPQAPMQFFDIIVVTDNGVKVCTYNVGPNHKI